MGKRSDFKRVERDYYPTPVEAVVPLIPHLPRYYFRYSEPCAGDGRLIEHIKNLSDGDCCYAADIEPRHALIKKGDALEGNFGYSSSVITNPPWDRKFLHPFLDVCIKEVGSTWLLFDADWMHTKQSIPYLPHLTDVVSIGRVKWIEGSASVGKDNCCWYHFNHYPTETINFHGRAE